MQEEIAFVEEYIAIFLAPISLIMYKKEKLDSCTKFNIQLNSNELTRRFFFSQDRDHGKICEENRANEVGQTV